MDALIKKCEIKRALLGLSVLFLSVAAVSDDWIYTVRSGDTLWGLCNEYTTRQNCWQEIGPYNSVTFPRSLAPGTRIRFPTEWLKAQPIPVEIISLTGSVDITINGSFGPMATRARQGDLLKIGTTIETRENARVSLRFADGGILLLEENSRLDLDALSQHGENGMVDSRVKLIRGKTNVQVPKREPRSHFSVGTPSAVAAVRGTEFRVQASDDENGTMLGAVYEGEIVVASDEEMLDTSGVQVPSGFGIRAEKGVALGQPFALLSPPQLNAIDANTFSPMTVSWQLVDGAEQYRIAVYESENGEEPITLEFVSATEVALDLESPYCYRLNVSAVDAQSLPGMPAETTVCVGRSLSKPISKAIEKTDVENNYAFEWEAIENANAYSIELASDVNFDNIIQSHTVDSTTFNAELIEPGIYYFRVQAIGDFDTRSQLSETQMLEVKKSTWLWKVLGTVVLIGVAVGL